ncbi:MAG: NAD(P)/FAD-dependent oxidoreductase [Bacteroidia bacterium]
MIKELNIVVPAEIAFNEPLLYEHVRKIEQISSDTLLHIELLKRSIDARSKNIKANLRLLVVIGEKYQSEKTIIRNYKNVSNSPEVIIIGAGPAGLFAGLKCLELGLKPIILERGKDVRSRRRDLAAINKKGEINPESNYCFGEGGAGTYSDGKLYTRSTKRGDVDKILETLVYHGADRNIMIESHPHIGTNKLPGIITAIREQIIKYGGEVHFNEKVIDLIIKNDNVEYVKTLSGNLYKGIAIILATGHSARDIFELLHKKQILIEAKPFALGVRVEHPQSLIDKIQLHCSTRPEYLPASSYSLVHQVNGRGVYSFCMCPGGIIAPCATDYHEVVTNGWSPSKRNNPFANSGIVVAVELEDLKKYYSFGALAAMQFQKEVEQMAYNYGGGKLKAPAQRLVDFTQNKQSSSLPSCSYHPGITSSPLHEWLPKNIGPRLQQAFKAFGDKMKGYLTNDAVIVGVESRTSSPVRIPRNKETLEHLQIKNLYPCGEGAGYAGGIVSAAIDGEKCVEKIALKYFKN